jgi:O-antigen ligase
MRFLLVALIALLTLSSVFNWDPGPAPGVKLQNGILYMLALALTLRVSFDRHFRIQLPAIQVTFIVLIAYAILSFLAVVFVIEYPYYNAFDNALILKTLVDQLLFFIVFFYGVRSEEEAMLMLKCLLLAFALSHVMAVLDAQGVVRFGDIERREDGRVQGLVGESNQYGAFVAMSLPAIIAMSVTTRGMERLFWWASALVTAITLLMTVSRGAFVATFVASVCAFVMFRRYAPPGRLAMLAIAAVLGTLLIAAVAIGLGFGELLYERVVNSASTDLGSTSSGRTEIWRNALGTMFETPMTLLTGFGWRAYWSMPFRYSPHNHYLNLWFNLGMIGLASSILLFALPLKAARSALATASAKARPTLMGFIVATIALALATFFVDLSMPWLYFWAYAGVAMRLAVNAQNALPQEERVQPSAARKSSYREDPFGWKAATRP